MVILGRINYSLQQDFTPIYFESEIVNVMRNKHEILISIPERFHAKTVDKIHYNTNLMNSYIRELYISNNSYSKSYEKQIYSDNQF